MITTYQVSGMTGEECVKAITDKVLALPGVDDVDVNDEFGYMEIYSDAEIDLVKVQEVVAEAGPYQVKLHG